MAEEIIIDVFPDGTQTIEVNGVKGSKCTEITKFLEAEGKVIDNTKKPEYYEKAVVLQKTQQKR